MKIFRLDDLYKMTVHIYSEQNAQRPTSATFSHFVEVCGMLTMHARKKKREGSTFVDALCKALGWYFPLMAKFNIASIEELIYRKFPYACPYCRKCPHVDSRCKTVKGTTGTVDHLALRKQYKDNADMRPIRLNDWQIMFNEIYPRELEPSPRSVVGLFEEVGELAEAIRVFYRFPKYLAGEAADVFSYLMGLANEYSIQIEAEGHAPLDLEMEYLQRFPGLCVQCGYPVCVCPSVPDSTVGRMAKELDVRKNDDLFGASLEDFRVEALRIEEIVVESFGGYRGIATRFPFDRGEANKALLLYCLEAAEQVNDPAIAERLRSAGLKAASLATYAGSPKKPAEMTEILKTVVDVIDSTTHRSESRPSGEEALQTIGQLIFNIGNDHITNIAGDSQQINVLSAQRWREIEDRVDLRATSVDVRELARLLSEEVYSAERDTAIEALIEAQLSADKGSGPKMLQHLAAAGKFTADFAAKVGSEVLSKLIEHSMGMS